MAILGARQVGKSTLRSQVLPAAPQFDLERSSHFDRISSDPEFFLSESPVPLVLDEAQRCPELFEALRVEINQRRNRPGQYLLSGSSSPELMHQLTETLDGRVAIIEPAGFRVEESGGGLQVVRRNRN